MIVKVFAHRGEAQTFLKEEDYKVLPAPFDGVFKNSNGDVLLLTGEGADSAGQKLATVLGMFFNSKNSEESPKEIHNYGVAGSLSNNLEVGAIKEIRTFYRQRDGEMLFHSYSCLAGTHDCITTNQRVLSNSQKDELDNFAPLIDREGWALAAVAKTFNIPFKAIKLVSDIVSDQSEVCKFVKENANEFSDKLYTYSIENNSNLFEETKSLPIPQHSYFTLSQKRRWNQTTNKLILKGFKEAELLSHLETVKISNEKLRPKELTSIYLEELKSLLNPQQKIINSKIKKTLEVFSHGQTQIKVDPNFEQPILNIKSQISHPKHITQLISSLEEFQFEEFESIFKGNLDV